MKILVTGGTGFLGRYLTAQLLDRGHEVDIMGRDFAPVQDLVARGVKPVGADLRDHGAVHAACAGKEAVFHVGAKSEPWGKCADFHAINAGGTAAVVEGCRMYDVRRLIYVSSPSVVFDGKDQIDATEKVLYPRRFTSVYALTKKLGEDAVNAARGEMETVIIRPKAIFGPGDRALLPRLIAAARRGRLPQIGDGKNLVDLTYVENVAQALVLALESPAAIGNTYTITNDEHPALWDLIREALRHLHLSTQLRQIPLGMAMAAASTMEAIAAVTGWAGAAGREPTLTRYSALILARTQTYDITAAKRDLGYTPHVSLAKGITCTLDAL
jgi:2-alkyl-3-oxoalkanoate reductase